jgi:hypothetical protein
MSVTGHTDIVLTGLIGSNPLGALAAFGLLRVCGEIPTLLKARLSWRIEDDWIAVLTLPGQIDENGLIACLSIRQQARQLDVFRWSPDIRVLPNEYREHLIQQAERARYYDRWNADYYAAFGSEMVTDGSKKLVKPTAFHMTSGQQNFLESVMELAESMHSRCSVALKEALFGPWTYNDDQHHLGLDPASERLYALRHKKPEKDRVKRSVLAAVWLAIEALPLFPTTVARGRLATTGFMRSDGNTRLVWPIWTEPISLDTLKTLIASAELAGEIGELESLGRRGVTTVYGAVRSDFGQGYAILRPATLVWSDS